MIPTHFNVYTKQDVLQLTKIRKFETKLGERIETALNPQSIAESLKASKAKFVVIGVPEDIGVKGNDGNGGADTAWLPFLQSFLNTKYYYLELLILMILLA
jgi:formiminoglutamase